MDSFKVSGRGRTLDTNHNRATFSGELVDPKEGCINELQCNGETTGKGFQVWTKKRGKARASSGYSRKGTKKNQYMFFLASTLIVCMLGTTVEASANCTDDSHKSGDTSTGILEASGHEDRSESYGAGELHRMPKLCQLFTILQGKFCGEIHRSRNGYPEPPETGFDNLSDRQHILGMDKIKLLSDPNGQGPNAGRISSSMGQLLEDDNIHMANDSDNIGDLLNNKTDSWELQKSSTNRLESPSAGFLLAPVLLLAFRLGHLKCGIMLVLASLELTDGKLLRFETESTAYKFLEGLAKDRSLKDIKGNHERVVEIASKVDFQYIFENERFSEEEVFSRNGRWVDYSPGTTVFNNMTTEQVPTISPHISNPVILKPQWIPSLPAEDRVDDLYCAYKPCELVTPTRNWTFLNVRHGEQQHWLNVYRREEMPLAVLPITMSTSTVKMYFKRVAFTYTDIIGCSNSSALFKPDLSMQCLALTEMEPNNWMWCTYECGFNGNYEGWNTGYTYSKAGGMVMPYKGKPWNKITGITDELTCTEEGLTKGFKLCYHNTVLGVGVGFTKVKGSYIPVGENAIICQKSKATANSELCACWSYKKLVEDPMCLSFPDEKTKSVATSCVGRCVEYLGEWWTISDWQTQHIGWNVYETINVLKTCTLFRNKDIKYAWTEWGFIDYRGMVYEDSADFTNGIIGINTCSVTLVKMLLSEDEKIKALRKLVASGSISSYSGMGNYKLFGTNINWPQTIINGTRSFYRDEDSANYGRLMFFKEKKAGYVSPLNARGKAGSKTVQVNNGIQVCSGRRYRWTRNLCMNLYTNEDTNRNLRALYITMGVLFTGGASLIGHLVRALVQWKWKKPLLAKKWMQLITYQYKWCDNPMMRKIIDERADLMKVMRLSAPRSMNSDTITSTDSADYTVDQTFTKDYSVEEWEAYFGRLRKAEIHFGTSFIRIIQRYMMMWLPWYFYAAILLAIPSAFVAFCWNIAWYYGGGETKENSKDMPFTEKQALLKEQKEWDSDEIIVSEQYIKAKRDIKKTYKKGADGAVMKSAKTLLLMHWLLIGPAWCLTHEYAIDCSNNVCTKAISIDQNIPLVEGAYVDIALRNPDTSIIDGQVLIKVSSVRANLTGLYDYTSSVGYSMVKTIFSDTDKCGQCNDPWSIPEVEGGWSSYDINDFIEIMSTMNWCWTNKAESTDSQSGHCVGMAGYAPDFDKPISRTFRTNQVEVQAEFQISVKTDQEAYDETIVTRFVGESFTIGHDGKIEFGLSEKPMSEMSGSSVVCYFEAYGDEPYIYDCRTGAPGISATSYFINTVGEGPSGYNAIRAPSVDCELTSAYSDCIDCAGLECCAGKSCVCDCTFRYQTRTLVDANKEDFLGVASGTLDHSCYAGAYLDPVEEVEIYEWCLDEKKETESECHPTIGTQWRKDRVMKPNALHIYSTGCDKSQVRVEAVIKTQYTAELQQSYISSSDVKFELDGCIGSNEQMELTVNSEEEGYMILESGNLIVPTQTLIVTGFNKVSATAYQEASEYTFSVIDPMENKKDKITLKISAEWCEGVIDGSAGDSGYVGGTTINEMSLWWLWMIIGIVIVALIIMLILWSINGKKATNYVERTYLSEPIEDTMIKKAL